MPKTDPVPLNSDNPGVQFMLAEFESLKSFKEQSVTIGNQRVDILIALGSAVVLGLGSLSQTNIDPSIYFALATVATGALYIIGSVTFAQVIVRDILVVDYIRSMNNIRAYFVKHFPEIKTFLLMPANSDYPEYDWVSSNRQIPLIINALTLVAFILFGRMWFDTLLDRTLTNTLSVLDYVTLLVAVLYSCISFLIQRALARRSFDVATEKARVYGSYSLYNAAERPRANRRQSDRKTQETLSNRQVNSQK